MLRIFKFCLYLLAFVNLIILNANSAEANKEKKYLDLKYYDDIYNKSINKTKKTINKLNKDGNRIYDLQINLVSKYLQYEDISFTTIKGTFPVNGNKINPQFAYGLGLGVATNLTKTIDIFLRSNYYFTSQSEKMTIGYDANNNIAYNNPPNTLSIESDSKVDFVELILGVNKKFALTSKQNIYLGTAISGEYYKISYNYLTDDTIQYSKSSEITTVGYNALLGYNIEIMDFYKIYLELNYKFLPHQSLIKSTSDLMLGFSYKFKL